VLAARAAKRAERKAAKAAAERSGWLAANSHITGLAIAAMAVAVTDCRGAGTIRDIAERAISRRKPLSPAQWRLVCRIAYRALQRTRERSQELERRPAPEGRTRIFGRIASVKWRESEWGGAYKMRIVCDGYSVWGTCPERIAVITDKSGWVVSEVALVGRTIALTARLERSRDDESFAYFTRPSKIELDAAGIWVSAAKARADIDDAALVEVDRLLENGAKLKAIEYCARTRQVRLA
jgi:hypothetical protein